ncbi:hypothetical protein L873DRAFT_1911921 [Choiromyces venosus 120613-1]|uniref:Uncharacterized protein n=1 Tax=Choiromyces venosus 120613-1 TaxID=1336337 RepID=A0A3N4JKE2_9PEZI|nr:hypothetical protein L873DRAFT_1911921 [Choiromyces venosus 120613-1]
MLFRIIPYNSNIEQLFSNLSHVHTKVCNNLSVDIIYQLAILRIITTDAIDDINSTLNLTEDKVNLLLGDINTLSFLTNETAEPIVPVPIFFNRTGELDLINTTEMIEHWNELDINVSKAPLSSELSEITSLHNLNSLQNFEVGLVRISGDVFIDIHYSTEEENNWTMEELTSLHLCS